MESLPYSSTTFICIAQFQGCWGAATTYEQTRLLTNINHFNFFLQSEFGPFPKTIEMCVYFTDWKCNNTLVSNFGVLRKYTNDYQLLKVSF